MAAEPPPSSPSRSPVTARWVVPLFGLAAIGLLTWSIWLGLSLPTHATADNYRAAWVGVDVFEVIALGCVAVFARKGDPRVELPAVSCAVLLLVDAWFDIMTAATASARTEAIVLAVVGELPLAACCWWIALHVEGVVRLGRRRTDDGAGD